MKLAIITHAVHMPFGGEWYSYGPYVREMNLWVQHASEVMITAPVLEIEPGVIDLPYNHGAIRLFHIPEVSLTSFSNTLAAIWNAPLICFRIWKTMKKADHIHLRCPGNIGLLGCLLQLFFPRKRKTAKYAGNWDPGSRQPLSYRFQKWLLSNPVLTRNMKVLVYGDWPDQSKNIKPFFTATYPDSKTEIPVNKYFAPSFRFLFVGTLSPGKRPLYVIQLVASFLEQGIGCSLDMYGAGAELEQLKHYISENKLTNKVILHGNRPAEEIEAAYRNAHFLMLPSKSEGWPKAVAEAMFWGVIPIASPVSCVPWMLGEGERGVLISISQEQDAKTLARMLKDTGQLSRMSEKAMHWSRQYTLDRFESEIAKLL